MEVTTNYREKIQCYSMQSFKQHKLVAFLLNGYFLTLVTCSHFHFIRSTFMNIRLRIIVKVSDTIGFDKS